MSLKINNGHSFLHPVSGLFIGPGDFFEDREPPQVEAQRKDIAITTEEFAKLNAGEQSTMLKDREIEPGTNKELRVQQYTEWLQGYTEWLQGQSGGSVASGIIDPADPAKDPSVGNGSGDPAYTNGDPVNPDPEKGAVGNGSSDSVNGPEAGAGGSGTTI
jgi:hypothetical protein